MCEAQANCSRYLECTYISLHVPVEWIFIYGSPDARGKIKLSFPPAFAYLEVLSANTENPDELLDSFFESEIIGYQQGGFRVDDLADDADYELIVEDPEHDRFIYLFYRRIDDVILKLSLHDYLEEHEAQMRSFLAGVRITSKDKNVSMLELMDCAPTHGMFNQIGKVLVASGI